MPNREIELQDPTYHDESNNRMIGQVYQNKTGKTMQLVIIVNMNISLKGDNAEGSLKAGKNNMVDELQTDSVFSNQDAVIDLAFATVDTLFLDIPPNYYYKFETNDIGMGICSIGSWYEVY